MTTEAAQATTLAQRTPAQDLVASVRSDEFKEQIALALPANITPEKFVRATVTALLQNPDLAKADRATLQQSIIKSAQDGLVPDGREAALVVFGGKVQYMPMIGGFRKIAAEHGWTIRTHVVYTNDEFDYTEEPQTITHRPVRPGAERGDLIAAYAVATHRDGRREQKVVSPEEIEKRRETARSKNVWNTWTAQMWEKTAGRDLFAELSLDPSDQRILRMIQYPDLEQGEAATMLYGAPAARKIVATELPSADAGDGGQQAVTDDHLLGEEPSGEGPSVTAPGDNEPAFDDSEPEDATIVEDVQALADTAAQFVPPTGQFADGGEHGPKTLEQIAASGAKGLSWIKWALTTLNEDSGSNTVEPGAYVRAVWNFARVYTPDLYTEALAKKELGQ